MMSSGISNKVTQVSKLSGKIRRINASGHLYTQIVMTIIHDVKKKRIGKKEVTMTYLVCNIIHMV